MSYVLSQFFVFMSLFAMWSMGKRMFHSGFHALVAVLVMLIIPYFSHYACEFNDDVIEIGLWAVMILFFHRALDGQDIWDWAAVGVAGGLAVMTKYLGVAICVSLATLLVILPEGRKSWRRPGIYIAAAIFWALVIPNLVWLYNHDFIAFHYAGGRSVEKTVVVPFPRIVNPLRLIGNYIVPLLLPVAALAVFFRRGRRAVVLRRDMIFLLPVMFGQFVLSLLFSLATGGKIIQSWLTPYYIVSGIFLVAVFRPVPDIFRLKLFMVFIAAITAVTVLVFGYEYLIQRPYLKKRCAYDCYPGHQVASRLTDEWRRRFNRPLQYVIGSRRTSCNMTFYSADRPSAFFDSDTALSQWIVPADIDRDGAVVIWDPEKPPVWLLQYEGQLQILPDFELERAVPWWFRRISGTPKMVTISSGFLPPAECR